ncbi:MAG: DJ-1/PfpI family protein [Chloroflexota bacterium]
MTEHLNLKQNQNLMLIAKNFDEEAVIQTLCQLRDEGLPVQLVGLTTGLKSGFHGIHVRPDTTVAQVVEKTIKLHSLIIAGGEECSSILLSDPRVFELMKKTFAQGGYVASMSPIAEGILTNVAPDYDIESQLLTAPNGRFDEVVNYVINQAAT